MTAALSQKVSDPKLHSSLDNNTAAIPQSPSVLLPFQDVPDPRYILNLDGSTFISGKGYRYILSTQTTPPYDDDYLVPCYTVDASGSCLSRREALHKRPFWAKSVRNFWSPQGIWTGKEFLIFGCSQLDQDMHPSHYLTLLSSKFPDQGYEDALNKPLFGYHKEINIDPAIFVDPVSSRNFLLWRKDDCVDEKRRFLVNRIVIKELLPNFMGFIDDSEPFDLLVGLKAGANANITNPESFVFDLDHPRFAPHEAPQLIYFQGKYLLTVSRGNAFDSTYRQILFVSDNLLGPFSEVPLYGKSNTANSLIHSKDYYGVGHVGVFSQTATDSNSQVRFGLTFNIIDPKAEHFHDHAHRLSVVSPLEFANTGLPEPIILPSSFPPIVKRKSH